MAIAIIILIIILMMRLNGRGKAVRYRKYQQHLRELKMGKQRTLTPDQLKKTVNKKKEAEYRADLKRQGYSDELITVILPTIMNDEQ